MLKIECGTKGQNKILMGYFFFPQHDCQEFMTLLLEALRKQMPLQESEEPTCIQDSILHSTADKNLNAGNIGQPSRSNSVSSGSSSQLEGSRGSLSPSPSQSPQCAPSPVSPIHIKQPSYEIKSDTQEVGPYYYYYSIINSHLSSIFETQNFREELKKRGRQGLQLNSI